LDSQFKSYEVFKISSEIWARCQPLPMQQNLPKIAKILPKTISSRNFEIPSKIEILVFSKKNSMYRGNIKACAHHLDFQYKNFPYAFLNVKKWPLYVNFSISLCVK
jgi:hypothetical protein